MCADLLFDLPNGIWFSVFSFGFVVKGRGAWFFVPKWRNTSAMGKWLQDNIYGRHCWSGCLHIKHTKTEDGRWDSGNTSYICLPKHPCKGTYHAHLSFSPKFQHLKFFVSITWAVSCKIIENDLVSCACLCVACPFGLVRLLVFSSIWNLPGLAFFIGVNLQELVYKFT